MPDIRWPLTGEAAEARTETRVRLRILFICVAFDRAGEFAEKYFRQGMRVLVSGRIQTGSYTNKDGQKVYTTDVIVEDQEFADSKNQSGDSGFGGGSYGGNNNRSSYQQGTRPAPSSAIGDGFMNIPDGVEDEGLPFN